MLVRTSSDSKMRIFRLVFGAYYLFLAASAACGVLAMDLSVPHKYVFGFRLMCIALSVIFALGAWTVWRERASKNFTKIGWPITASLMNVLMGFGIPALAYFCGDRSNFLQSNRDFAIPAAMGVLGLIVFRRRTPPKTVSAT
jgi:hypothetical protein